MQSSQQIRVMLVDDQLMTRMGLAIMVKKSEGLDVVAEAANGETAIAICGEIMPDVILMDLVMPGVDGTTAIRTIRHLYPQVRMIAVSGLESEEAIRSALVAGAAGYLSKDVSVEELVAAIRAVHTGIDALSPRILRKLSRSQSAVSSPTVYLLTVREKEVLAFMVEGLNNPDIAKRMVVSLTTIKSHVSNIFGKLKVANRTEAVAFTLRAKLLI